MLHWRTISFVALSLLVPSGAVGASDRQSPLHGALAAGPHPVGFTTLRIDDATRPQSPAQRTRTLVVHVWYPSKGARGDVMTFDDAMLEAVAGEPADVRGRRAADTRAFLTRFGPVTDDAWTALRRTPLLARRDDIAADGRFPLLIGQLRPLSTAITNEYLASHGFVVAMTHALPAPEPRDPGAALELGYRDMEFAIPAVRRLPYVDPVPLGTFGFSGSGFSQILLAMRHPDVMAVSDLESAIFDGRMLWPLWRGWGYDVAAMRVPFLHMYSVPLSGQENRLGDFEKMRYSQRYHYLVDAPGIHHWDFATEGMAASAVLRNRGAQGTRLQQAFETTNRYLLAFFNAFVKRDERELAFLRRMPDANGAPAGLATIRELPAIVPAPTSDEFVELILRDGSARAMEAFGAARARDPEAPLFIAAELNQVGYRLLRQQKSAEAIAVFRQALDLYPDTANPYDSLSEALEAAGDRAGALDIATRGLDVLAREELPAARREQLRGLLSARVKRLSDG